MMQKIRLEIVSPNYSQGKSTVRQICEKALEAQGWKITNRRYSFYSEILHLEKPYELTTGGKNDR